MLHYSFVRKYVEMAVRPLKRGARNTHISLRRKISQVHPCRQLLQTHRYLKLQLLKGELGNNQAGELENIPDVDWNVEK
jgi:hypothetical protein